MVSNFLFNTHIKFLSFRRFLFPFILKSILHSSLFPFSQYDIQVLFISFIYDRPLSLVFFPIILFHFPPSPISMFLSFSRLPDNFFNLSSFPPVRCYFLLSPVSRLLTTAQPFIPSPFRPVTFPLLEGRLSKDFRPLLWFFIYQLHLIYLKGQ
jgi:hypothetical protein